MWGYGAEVLSLEPLADGEAAWMLRDLSGAGDEEQARNLARRLGGLPLALRVAGGHLSSPFSRWNSFEAYENALDATGVGAGTDTDHGVGVEHDPRQAVMSTFELSLDSLAEAGVPQARPLLRLLSCYAPGVPVPVSILATGPTSGLFGAAAGGDVQRNLHVGLRNLARLSLATEHSLLIDAAPAKAVTLHPVVAEVSRNHLQLNELESGRSTHQIAVQLMVAAIAPVCFDDNRTWPIAKALAPHIRQMLDTTSAMLDDSHLAQLLAAATQVVAVSAWSGAERAGENLAADALNRTGPLGDNHPICLQPRAERAWAIGRHGRWEEARGLLAAVHEA